MPAQNGMIPVVVARTAADGSATVVMADGKELVLPAAASKWTGRTPAKLFKRGDMARIKAGKEEIVGLLAALDRFVKADDAADNAAGVSDRKTDDPKVDDRFMRAL